METKVKYANGNFANLFLYESPTLLSGMNRALLASYLAVLMQIRLL
jgi:hypothetical protein